MKIAPSILAADFSMLGQEIAKVSQADLIHIDVMDGHFVPNITLGPDLVRNIRPHTTLPFDVHLMIEHPDRYIEDFVKSGADSISIHQEATVHLHRTLMQIKEFGLKAGIALNPATSLTTVKDVIPDIDYLVLMTVNPGFGGQLFIRSMLDKIKRAYDLTRGSIDIMVDGGITLDNAKEVVEAGANILVAGSAVFKSDNPALVLESMRRVCDNA